MTVYRFGCMRVAIRDGYTATTLPNGRVVTGVHTEQPGQAETAQRAGYPTVEALNRDHDLAHGLLTEWLGLAASPALMSAAAGFPACDVTDAEEAAVLAVQRYALLVGVDLLTLAEEFRHG